MGKSRVDHNTHISPRIIMTYCGLGVEYTYRDLGVVGEIYRPVFWGEDDFLVSGRLVHMSAIKSSSGPWTGEVGCKFKGAAGGTEEEQGLTREILFRYEGSRSSINIGDVGSRERSVCSGAMVSMRGWGDLNQEMCSVVNKDMYRFGGSRKYK